MNYTTVIDIHSRLGVIPAGTTLTLHPQAIERYREMLKYRVLGVIDVEHPLHDGAYMGVNITVFDADTRRELIDQATR